MWFDAFVRRRHTGEVRAQRRRARVGRGEPKGRRMRLEPLEERRLLALGDLVRTLPDPGTNVQTEAEFGYSAAADGDFFVVGVPGADVEGKSDAGLAYVYDAATGNLLRTLHHPTPRLSAGFGTSVALSGNTLVVGGELGDSVCIYDATTGNLRWTLNDPSPAGGHRFGASVAVSGDTVVVGSRGDDTLAESAGRAYVYDASTGDLLWTLDNPTPAEFDTFGCSVAVSGNTVAVGAFQDDTLGTSVGSAYIFDAATGSLRWTLNNPTPEEYEKFGNCVAASGNRVVVAAYAENTGADRAGSVYVYDATLGSLLRTINNPVPEKSDYFGNALALSGNTLVVGAFYDDAGANSNGSAYVLDAATGTLLQTLNGPIATDQDFFGHSVAFSGDKVVVGAINDDADATDSGAAYVFDAPTGGLIQRLENPTPANDERFGYSVAISGDTMVIGAHETGEDDEGAAYILDAATGDLLHVLDNPTPEVNGHFGHAVAVSGNTAVVGEYQDDNFANGDGSAYVYNASLGVRIRTLNNPTPEDFDRFGFSVAVSGDAVVVGAYLDDTGAVDAGSAYIFDAPTGNLRWTLNNPTPATYDMFGSAVAVSGNTVVVGAGGDDTDVSDGGSVYIYDATTGNLLRRLGAPAPASGDNFGNSVAIAGNTLVVGALSDDTGAINAGAAHVFDAATGDLISTMNNPAPTAMHEYFGNFVALSGSTVVVGTFRDDTSQPNSGSAYIFDAATGCLLATLDNPTPGNGNCFGRCVAISGNRAVVGEPHEEGAAKDRGEAHLFDATRSQSPTDISLSGSSLAENQPVGTAVGTFSATDPDPGDSHTYSLISGAGDTDNASFSIDGNQLETAEVFDYETKSSYSIRVLADDGHGGVYAEAFTISVTDVDEDFGDAPDTGPGTGSGDYNTLSSDNGPSHQIVAGIQMGTAVDPDPDGQPTVPADGDDLNGPTPDDEDGLLDPAGDLDLLAGETPAVDVKVTNNTGAAATLYGWIDYNGDGLFSNAGERALIPVPSGTNDATVTLTFPAVPAGFAGDTYARFRLSTDAAAADPTGAAGDGEVEDYTASVHATIVDGSRVIFYDNSYWDGSVEGPNTSGGPEGSGDDGAIATDKSALLPGGTATAANFTTYDKGINGIMVDVAGLANPTAVGDGDFSEFVFKAGNDSNPSGAGWSEAAAPTDVDVRDLGGGVYRVSFFWGAGAIPTRNWLQLTLNADEATTGLAQDDVFYFGNCIGDANLDGKTLYDDIFAIYTAVDFVNFKPITEPCDVNRDGKVLYDDIFACYSHIDFTNRLALINPPATPSPPGVGSGAPLSGEMFWAAHLAALDEWDRSSTDSEEEDRETAGDAVFAAYGDE